MEYNFTDIEKRAKDKWAKDKVYEVSNDTNKPKCYILDMFPYPSGAGLHVGHPLGYIGSDIYARYKRLCGYNVLHPMGFDAFGLPAEQYAIETGQHPEETTRKNIGRYREQLDNIGFCFDWSREVRTSDPKYYKWTQWIFLQLFHSWYDRKQNKARPIKELIEIFEKEGNINCPCPGDEAQQFDSIRWKDFSEKEQRDVLMQYRIAYQGYAQVWWCEALGTVLANDEVVNGVSERGGFPVERKNMRQWFLRITEYADRLITSLDTLEWSDAMKEMQKNWIGKSVGAEVRFDLSPPLSEGEGGVAQTHGEKLNDEKPGWNTAEPSLYNLIGGFRKDLKDNPTEAENILWLQLKANQLGVKFRRQHVIGRFIADFVCLPARLIVEVDGKIHEQQKETDAERTAYLNEKGFKVIRFTNEEVIANIESVIEKIKNQIAIIPQVDNEARNISLSFGEGRGEVSISVFTTRPDTIFGVDFMVLAPEHELVDIITSAEQKEDVAKYVHYVKSRSERERMSEVKQVTGCFTGAYAIHPLTGKQLPVWISEYVLINYGTGAIMAVPSGDERDHAFAKHFNIPVTNIFGSRYNGENAYSDKTGKIENSDFLSGINIPEATEAAINALVAEGVGKRKVNYKLRDAGFSRQRYWGEPFPIMYVDDIPYGIDEVPFKNTELNKLPVELPYVESYGPGPEGQGPLANLREWTSPRPSPQVERELAHYFDRLNSDEPVNILSGEKRINIGPKYSVASIKQYENARINRKNATEAEDILWQNLRGNKLGEKFRRQHPIESYIVDFVCLSKGIIIEADGGYHEIPDQVEYDKDRTRVLEELGFRVIRFTNDMVINQTEDVLITIKKLLLSSVHIVPGSSIANISTVSDSLIRNNDNTSLSISGEGRGEVSRETNTMPGYAGSSWYFLRYMDPHNDTEFASRKAMDYWNQVDLYVGGTEHAVGHLLYSRMWTKALYDLGYIGFDEPFKRLLNQGMIQGSSRFVYRIMASYGGVAKSHGEIPLVFVSKNIADDINNIASPEHKEEVKQLLQSIYQAIDIHDIAIHPMYVDINFVNGVELNIEKFRSKKTDNPSIYFILNDKSIDYPFKKSDSGKYICGAEVEKMSKSKYNVVNPDDIVAQYGADTFRMYEMFLGPIDISKPWDTKGIEGVHRFLKKMWRLYFGDAGWIVTDEAATDAELRVLHKTIKKIGEDIERFSFNTSVSQFMICVNELATLGCHKRAILEPLAVAICPFAPHIAEELWQKLGHTTSVVDAPFPKYEERYVTENTKKYPVAVNGKTRIEMEFPLDAEPAIVEQEVLADATIQKWLEGKAPKKFIYVKGKMINVVV